MMPARLLAACSVAAALVSCMDREPAPVCPVPTELNQSASFIAPFEGVDMLVVVDNSGSMAEEQEVLATSFFTLVNSLVDPLPGWKYPPADDVRIAVVSSDMGLQWGGKPYEAGDGWPNDAIPCTAAGDNGNFQTYGSGKAIDLQHNMIPCDGDGSQCPTGWTCGGIGDDPDHPQWGLCQAPGGDGSDQECPGLAAIWAETPQASTDPPAPNPELAFQVACLSALGTDGCGFEQQLQAAAVGLHRSDQAAFVRANALLSVMVVSDEEDCSIESNELFAAPEIQDQAQGEINIACGNNEQFLYDTELLYDTFVAAKDGREDAVIFAAVVGVPPGDDSPCQGSGHELGACLDAEEMQNVPVIENDAWFFRPACTRFEGDVEVTKARPGRRYVELAQQASSMGYVYSICNADWSPAMEDIARLIAESMGGTCYPKPLDWDPLTRQAKCQAVAEYVDVEKCPFDTGDAEVVTEEWTDADEVEHTTTYCPLPKIAAERDCAAMAEPPSEFGWYYCENNGSAGESFDEVCADGLDNDNNGAADCDDSACADCPVCGGTGVDCDNTCKYVVRLTEAAKQAVIGQRLSVQCLQQFAFEDPNCQENTPEACTDDADNDGNGIWDCEADYAGDRPHASDPHCCPMAVDGQQRCVIDDAAFDNCPDSTPADLPDACRAAADLLGCQLPV